MLSIAYILGLIGMNVFLDGLYSIILYLHKDSYRGDMQTWGKDHWVRCVRMGYGLVLIIIGWWLVENIK